MKLEVNNKNIVWIASYPKSGNTWFRAIIANLITDPVEPLSINKLNIIPNAANRHLFDEYSGFFSSDLSIPEIDTIRPFVYREFSKHNALVNYMKIHDALTFNQEGHLIIPPENTLASVYIVRNPLDVVVSFAHHSHKSFDTIIDWMNDEHFIFYYNRDKLYNQLHQRLLSWSGHVNSWIENYSVHPVMVRYEDLMEDTLLNVKNVLGKAGLDFPHSVIEKAIKFSTFEELKKQEEQEGFIEKSPVAETFFRKARVNDWKKQLTRSQVKRITQSHGDTMKKLNYL